MKLPDTSRVARDDTAAVSYEFPKLSDFERWFNTMWQATARAVAGAPG
jgi:hypothetical protein